MEYEIKIEDQTDAEDTNINGVIHFKIPINKEVCDATCPDGTLLDKDCALCVINCFEAIYMLYHFPLLNFVVDIEILDINFKDGWMDYSIEGKESEKACESWKKYRGDI